MNMLMSMAGEVSATRFWLDATVRPMCSSANNDCTQESLTWLGP